MIPKIIHYCWMSDVPIPERLQNYMNLWRQKLPDYEFILWNYTRFPKGQSKWVDEAFAKRMFPFCADYIRMYALYNYGGIYLDSDVEVLNNFDDLLQLKTMVCWQNKLRGLELAAFGAEKGCKWIKLILDTYDTLSFIDENGNYNDEPMPYVVDDILRANGYSFINTSSKEEALKINEEKNIPVLPSDFFSPLSYLENKMDTTRNTRCIHHFVGSWTDKPNYEVLEQRFWNSLNMPNKFYLTRLLNIFTMRSNLWGKYKRRRRGL